MSGRGSRQRVEHRVGAAEAGQTVEQVLLGAMGLSHRMLQRLTRARAIEINRRPAFLRRKVRAGDELVVRLPEDRAESTLAPVPMPLHVAYEDADLLVIDKPPHLLVHPTRAAQTHTLAHGIAAYLDHAGQAGVARPVHRLDRDTSGLVLFAKSGFAHQALDRQLRAGTLRRSYLVLVAGAPAEERATIDAPIGRRRGDPVRREVRADGDSARTHFEVIERFPGAALLRVQLETGRTHQIRVHLAHLGHPVLGDPLYGPRERPAIMARQALHAAQLAFIHPRSGEPVWIEAPLPDDLTAALERLRDAR